MGSRLESRVQSLLEYQHTNLLHHLLLVHRLLRRQFRQQCLLLSRPAVRVPLRLADLHLRRLPNLVQNPAVRRLYCHRAALVGDQQLVRVLFLVLSLARSLLLYHRQLLALSLLYFQV